MEDKLEQVVENLWQLQKIMTELKEKERQIREKPASFAALDREYSEATSQIEAMDTRLQEIEMQRRKLDGDLLAEQEVLKKYQGQLMQVKNQQQYAAAWKEIDVTRKKIKDIEDELLKAMTETDEIQAKIEGQKGSYGELQDLYNVAHGEWQASLENVREEITKLRQRAKEVESRIPERWRQQFHRIFEQRQGLAVVLVEQGACSACRVRIRPHVDQRLRRGELTSCDGCHRIFYMERVAS